MSNWMTGLSQHYERIRQKYPNEKLMILFDIDGTILDMRYMMLHVLQTFDRQYLTTFFSHLQASDIRVHENHLDQLFAALSIPLPMRDRIRQWYLQYRWYSEAVLESHRPFAGVMEVIRWFQIQPNTDVGLNTARPEMIREDTLPP